MTSVDIWIILLFTVGQGLAGWCIAYRPWVSKETREKHWADIRALEARAQAALKCKPEEWFARGTGKLQSPAAWALSQTRPVKVPPIEQARLVWGIPTEEN
jgi:hypothetical protein